MIYYKFTNGIGKSKEDQNAFDGLVNCDIHTSPGTIRPQLALATESTTPNENCICVTVPNGDVYFLSKASGKIWKRTYAGVYSLVNTNANGAHLGGAFFNGYLHYATATKLGRYDLVSTWTDSWQTFTQTATYRPFFASGLSLYIGNGVYVASVDNSNTFSDNVLDLRTGYSVTAITNIGTDILVGTIQSGNQNNCSVFQWDTYSPSWREEYLINENSVNCFIQSSGIVFAQCGASGNIYNLGEGFSIYKKIRGVTTSINPYAFTMYGGRALFATGTAIYSLHRGDRDFNIVLCQEYTASATVASIVSAGSYLLVSIGTSIQKPGTTYATATIDTPEVGDVCNNVIVKYDSYAEGIGISTNSNNAGSYTAQTPIVDSNRRFVYFNGGLLNCRQLQARITMTPDGASYPVIKSIEIE